MSTINSQSKYFTDKPLYLWLTASILLLLAYYYHGFQVYSSDTIETVPYALWLADNSLFPSDFHLSFLREIIPNERIVISGILHFFSANISLASHIFHGICSIFLFAGMVRLADIILKNIELAIIAVFITVFSLYNINVGSNELYYNMFVPSLAGKAAAIWALVFFIQKRKWLTTSVLILATFLHPLVGFQLFIVLTGINIFLHYKDKESYFTVLFYLITAGLWILFILLGQNNSEIASELITKISFFEIIEYRIGHHFFPAYFPKSHLVISILLYTFGLIYFFKKNTKFFYFFIISLIGIIIYFVGLFFQWELILSSQWMKINIWLKFLSVIASIALIQNLFEKKTHRLITLIIFIGSLGFAINRFAPVYDDPPSVDLYTWISINTNKEDLFLVPPQLVDFKARTLRSSYFDFKAMLHHKPAIYLWADRFYEVYGMEAKNRHKGISIFTAVRDNYLSTYKREAFDSVDYIIVPKYLSTVINTLENDGNNPAFNGDKYKVYKR